MVETGFNTAPTNAPQQMFAFGGGQGGPSTGYTSQFAPFNNPDFGKSSTFFQNSAITQTSGQAAEQANGISASDALDAASSIRKLSNTDIPGQGMFSGLNNSINQFGADAFGLSNGLNYTGPIGPVQPGVDALAGISNAGNTGATLGSTLGAAGFGFAAGGYLSGLLGGNTKNGSIGGAIGGALGNLALGSSITTGLGTALGAAGSVLPGVGTVIGMAAGSLLGGLFGKKKPNPASGFGSTSGLNPDGSIKDTFFGSKHLDDSTGKAVASDFESFMKNQAKKYGIEYKNITGVYGGTDKYYGDAGGYLGITNDPKVKSWYGKGVGMGPTQSNDNTLIQSFDISNPKEREKAYQEAWRFAVKSSGLNPDTLVEKAPVGSGGVGSNVFNVPSAREESTFDKFLKDYREKQNANLA